MEIPFGLMKHRQFRYGVVKWKSYPGLRPPAYLQALIRRRKISEQVHRIAMTWPMLSLDEILKSEFWILIHRRYPKRKPGLLSHVPLTPFIYCVYQSSKFNSSSRWR
jgi:hypothetical protein